MLNRWVGCGRLTRDPELRHTQSGTAVAAFTLAIDRDYAGQGNEKATDFIDVVAWRQKGDFVAKYFKKGQMAVVEGRLQVRDYTDNDGKKRRVWEVIAENVYFAGGKRSDAPATAASPAPAPGEYTELKEDDGDLPF